MPAQRNRNIANQHRNRHDNYNIRPRKHPLQRQGTNGEQASHEEAKTTVHQQNRCSSHGMTINRPHASRQNTKLARHAWVETETASDGSATPWCATPTDRHIHEHRKTPGLYHYGPDQPTLTNYTTLHLDKPRRN